MTTETSLAISRDSNAISGGGSNANSGGGSGTVDSQQENSRDSNAISGGGSNANSGGWSNGSDTQQAINQDSNANSGGGSDVVDSQQVISRDSNAISGGGSNANSGGQSAANTSGPTVLEVRDPPARKASRRAVVYDKYTRDAFIAIVSCNSAADRNRDCQRPTSRTRMCTPSLSTSIS